jgi:predicted phage tail protein
MSEPSLKALLRELVDDTTQLFRQELRLAQAEVKQSIHQAQANVVLIVAGLMLAFCALLILLEAIVMALATAMPGWLASIIVAVVAGGIAIAMVGRGEKGLAGGELAPSRSIRQAKADKDMIMEKVS